MKIHGKDIEDWGLSVIKYDGILNLPARAEPTHYDWGDLIEPLVGREDIHFQPLSFSAAMFYEKKQDLKSRLKNYKIKALGLNATPAFGLRGGGLFDEQDQRLFSLVDHYNIFTIKDGEWTRRNFDTWGYDADRKAMSEYLGSLLQGQTVVIALR